VRCVNKISFKLYSWTRNTHSCLCSVVYYQHMSKVSSDHRNFAHQGHDTVAHAQSYLANIPEGVRHVLIAVASISCKLGLLKYG
jgi:hypothetical protein